MSPRFGETILQIIHNFHNYNCHNLFVKIKCNKIIFNWSMYMTIYWHVISWINTFSQNKINEISFAWIRTHTHTIQNRWDIIYISGHTQLMQVLCSSYCCYSLLRPRWCFQVRSYHAQPHFSKLIYLNS